MLLTGKMALITGFGQGVGQSNAIAPAAEGAGVAVTGRTREKLVNTCGLIQQRGGEALPVVCDVKSLSSMEQCLATVLEHYGGLQILVNNAQEAPLGTLEEVTDKSFTAGWESGPLATFRLMKLCRPHLRGDGCIINLG